jgi:hypothetical protein
VKEFTTKTQRDEVTSAQNIFVPSCLGGEDFSLFYRGIRPVTNLPCMNNDKSQNQSADNNHNRCDDSVLDVASYKHFAAGELLLNRLRIIPLYDQKIIEAG